MIMGPGGRVVRMVPRARKLRGLGQTTNLWNLITACAYAATNPDLCYTQGAQAAVTPIGGGSTVTAGQVVSPSIFYPSTQAPPVPGAPTSNTPDTNASDALLGAAWNQFTHQNKQFFQDLPAGKTPTQTLLPNLSLPTLPSLNLDPSTWSGTTWALVIAAGVLLLVFVRR